MYFSTQRNVSIYAVNNPGHTFFKSVRSENCQLWMHTYNTALKVSRAYADVIVVPWMFMIFEFLRIPAIIKAAKDSRNISWNNYLSEYCFPCNSTKNKKNGEPIHAMIFSNTVWLRRCKRNCDIFSQKNFLLFWIIDSKRLCSRIVRIIGLLKSMWLFRTELAITEPYSTAGISFPVQFAFNGSHERGSSNIWWKLAKHNGCCAMYWYTFPHCMRCAQLAKIPPTNWIHHGLAILPPNGGLAQPR